MKSGVCNIDYSNEYEVDVLPKVLTIGGSFTAHDKAHNGTTDAEIDENNLTLEGKVEGDNVVLVSIVVQFASPVIANDVLVSIVSAELDGADKGNYTLSLTGAPTTSASITTTTGIETGTLHLANGQLAQHRMVKR